MAIFFSYLGNYFSQKGILRASNPGYSLIIQKSYVFFTTIFAVFLLKSALSLQKSIAIICIVGFSSLIILSKKRVQVKKSNHGWIAPSFGAFFAYGFLALSSKYLLDKGIEPVIMLFYLFLITSVIIGLELIIKKTPLNLVRSDVPVLVGIGIFHFIFNLFMWYAYKLAPNPGYVNATNAASISFLTVFSILLFKDEFSWRKMIGVIGVTAGLVLIFM